MTSDKIMAILKTYEKYGSTIEKAVHRWTRSHCYYHTLWIVKCVEIHLNAKWCGTWLKTLPYHTALSNELYGCRALDAVSMSWDNLHLKHILSSDTYCSHVPDSSLTVGSFNSQGQPLWHGEFIPDEDCCTCICFQDNFIIWSWWITWS